MSKEKHMKDKGKKETFIILLLYALVKLKIFSTIENPKHFVFSK